MANATSNGRKPNGLILIGGRSTRMGQDKSQLIYHDKPQREHLTDLLKPFCNAVFWSVNADQAADLSGSGQPLIVDVFDWPGPLNGILSAFRYDPVTAWLVVACDMPFLSRTTIRTLDYYQRESIGKIVTAFRGTDGLPDPLLSIWEPSAYPHLQEFVAQGGHSPRKFMLDRHDQVTILDAPDELELMNANDPTTRMESKRKLDLMNSYPRLTFYPAGSDPFDVSHPCPICGVGQPASPRYEQYICGNCVERATDETGNRLRFYNADMSGGLLVQMEQTGETVETDECLIDGIRCSVVEGRFGGIVVQPKK